MDSYEIFKKQVNDFINIDLNYYKEKQMRRRITSLLTRNNYKDFDDYYIGLRNDKKLLDEFVNYLTINVSEFYRNPGQWQTLEEEILPYLIRGTKKCPKIWSAACSTGEEPYSIVMLLNKFFALKDIKVLATDIDLGAINKAKFGLYNEKSLDNLPKEFKYKYFEKIENSFIQSLFHYTHFHLLPVSSKCSILPHVRTLSNLSSTLQAFFYAHVHDFASCVREAFGRLLSHSTSYLLGWRFATGPLTCIWECTQRQ